MKGYRNFLKRLANFQVRNPYLTILIIVGITLIFYGGMVNVKTVASLEQMMPKSVEEIKAFNELRDNGMGKDMIGIVVEINRESTNINGIFDIRDKRSLEYIQKVDNILENEKDIINVHSASDIIVQALKAKEMETKIKNLDDKTYNDIIESEEVSKELGNFIDDEYTTSVIIATTDVSAVDSRMKPLAERINVNIDSIGKPSGIDIRLTGTPIIQQKLGILISKDRNTTQLISTVFVFLITMVVFGTFSSALVPIIIVTVSVTWLYGMMGYFGLPISTLAGGVAAMVIGIGIDYSIHLMNKFKNERKEGKDVEASIERAVSETGNALSGAAIATMLAFIAFLVGSMPEMNRFGLLMVIGVGSAFSLSLFGLPALLIIEEKVIHYISKNFKFGIEGEYVLYEKDKIHPEDHEMAAPSEKDLKTIYKNYKIVKKKRRKK